MRLTIPLTGTVLVEGSVFGEGKLTGDSKDFIRPIPINLGNVSWTMVDVDLENEVMIIEVQPAEGVSEDTGRVDGEGEPIYTRRKATEQEKAGFLQHARNLIEGHTKDELYKMSKSAKLKRPFK
ncbi:MAG TPA: hypothetical protein VMW64_08225 [Dehalococcoidia bacterium]|nr:hypothetical protein [Dehalococcoidia bacterium]